MAIRRSALQEMYVSIGAEIEKLNHQVAEQAGRRSGARLLMTHPGVGPVTALATDVFLGDPQRATAGLVRDTAIKRRVKRIWWQELPTMVNRALRQRVVEAWVRDNL